MSKYIIPVYAVATASMFVGNVECDSYEEFIEKREQLWDDEEPYITAYSCNNFDIGDTEPEEIKESKIERYSTKIEEK